MMDTSDVEMKDATEKPQDIHEGELHPQNGSDDVAPQVNDEKLPHSSTGKDTEPAELGTLENLDGVTEPKDEVTAAKNTEKPPDIHDEELHPQNVSDDVVPMENDEKLPHSGTGKDTEPAELETQENLDGVTEPKDEVNAAKNSESELENPNSKEPAELGTQEHLDGVTKPKDEVEAAKSTESQLEGPNNKEIANELGMAAENVDHDPQLGDKTGEDQMIQENTELEKTTLEKGTVPAEITVEKAIHNETGVSGKKDEATDDEVIKSENAEMVNEATQSEKMVAPTPSLEDGDKFPEAERKCSDADQNPTEAKIDAPKDHAKGIAANTNAILGTSLDDQNPTTPLSMMKCPSTKSGGQSEESYRNMFNESKIPGDVDGTPQEQIAFMRELESFYRERATEFKAPKFYGNQLNCLKLWRSVIRLGGYDRVTGSKLWRQVGESFHPPKTCTTVSWTFRIFYEKALLEYERHMTESGELQLPLFTGSDPSSADNEGSSVQPLGPGRARRDSATRAMQGWHSRLQDNGEGADQIMQDKNGNNMLKREKSMKSIGSLKQKRPDEVEYPVKTARTEQSKQLVTSVVDVGPPADWVRINVRETKDSYEVYALVPGLLREEVRIQSDPAGRLVITGQPDQPDNPWGITAFKKVVSLPGRIDPLQTSAVVSLHGRLFVRVPFEQ